MDLSGDVAVSDGMTPEEFQALFIECGAAVADRFYPKNSTAAQGGEPSGRRGEFLRDLGVLEVLLFERLLTEGVLR